MRLACSVIILSLIIYLAYWKNFPDVQHGAENDQRLQLADDSLHYLKQHTDLIGDIPGQEKQFQEDFFDDSMEEVSEGFWEYGSEMVLWVNGSPVSINLWGGPFVRLDGFLVNGENTIELQGGCEEKMFIKVFQWPNEVPDIHEVKDHEFRVVTKQRIEPFKGMHSHKFKTKTAYEDVFDDLPQEGIAKQKLEKEIANWMKQIDTAIRKHQGNKAYQLLYKNYELAPQIFHPYSPADLPDVYSDRVDFINRRQHKVLSGSEVFRYLWGKKSVLVYGKNVSESTIGVSFPVSWKVDGGKDDTKLHTPLLIVRIDGKLLVLH